MKKWRAVLSLVLATVMLCMFDVPVNAAGVIYVSSESELKAIADNPYGHYVLTTNIELSDSAWTDLGEFYGSLDGAGYAITNLNSTGDGLFFYLMEGSVVQNLTILGQMQITDDYGALLAAGSDGTVYNCTSRGEITVSDGTAGGLIVENYGTIEDCVNEAVITNGNGGIVANNLGTVKDCINKGNIISDVMYPGGIAGINNDLIVDCVNTANITSTLNQEGYNVAAGGIVGENVGMIMNCLNQGVIHQQISTDGNAGGIVGQCGGTSQIIGCENQAKVYGVGEIGGICGKVELTSGIFNEDNVLEVTSGNIVIADCENSGEVQVTMPEDYLANGGGIVGNIASAAGLVQVLNCRNTASVYGENASCGGSVGMAYIYDNGDVSLQNLYNSGTVTSVGYCSAAGIVASLQNDTEASVEVLYCRNDGAINGPNAYGVGEIGSNSLIQYCVNTGDVTGNNVAGGISHALYGGSQIADCYILGTITGSSPVAMTTGYDVDSVIRNCYYYGDLQGSFEEYICRDLGAISVVNCYYLQQDFINPQYHGTALSAEAMQAQASYVGFDFDNVWEMQEQNGVMLPAIKKTPETATVGLQSRTVLLRPEEAFIPQATQGTIVSYYSDNYALLGDDDLWDDDENIKARGLGTVTVYCVFSDGQVVPCTVEISERGDWVLEPTAETIAFVERMYTNVLGRAAEEDGMEYWSYSLANYAADGASLARGFVLSPEFMDKNVDNEEFVEILYLTFMDRAGEADGISYWANQLDAGTTRIMVLVGFVNSPEFSDVCDNYNIARGTMQGDGTVLYNKGVRDFVERMYLKALERDGETMGIEYWTNRLLLGQVTPEQVAKDYFHSPEYLNKNTADEKYVEALYQTFMDRESEAAGMQYWLDKLANGVSRDEVLEGFSNAPEFAEIMERYGF